MTSESTRTLLLERLRLLRQEYVQQLPDKLRYIETAWETFLHKGKDPGTLEVMRSRVHNLVGSGATFGLKEISDTARGLELFLKMVLESGGLPTVEQQTQVDTLLVQLEHVYAEVAAEDVSEPRYQPAPVQPGEPESDNRLIFLVEADPYEANHLALQIGHFGYTVRTCTNFAELREALAREAAAAVIMDIMFREGDLSAAEMVAEVQRSRTSAIPFIFASNRSDLHSRLMAVRAGGRAYFTKPIDVSALIDKLDALTAHRAPEPYRILIVDDERPLAAYYSFILQHAGMITMEVTNPTRVMQPLIELNPDLILMDVYMPGCHGPELAAAIRQYETYVSTPIVFLSTETNLDQQLAAMHQGGDDFLTKPIQPDHLISSVTARVQRSRVLRSFMMRDSLTGLLNHTTIKEQLEVEIVRARRQHTPLALAIIDIDHFKSVNDTYGHAIGDRVIKSLARLLQQRLRKSDIIGRYGGEEFAVILPDTHGTAAVKVLDEIRDGFAQIRQQSEGAEFSITFSCGIAGFAFDSSASELADAADKALYAAKHGGRNRVILAETSPESPRSAPGGGRRCNRARAPVRAPDTAEALKS